MIGDTGGKVIDITQKGIVIDSVPEKETERMREIAEGPKLTMISRQTQTSSAEATTKNPKGLKKERPLRK